MKNYSDLINNKAKRTLSAKGNKFLSKCIDIVAKSKGLTRYHSEMNTLKENLSKNIKFLIIDKEMNLEEIKEIIKNSKNIEIN